MVFASPLLLFILALLHAILLAPTHAGSVPATTAGGDEGVRSLGGQHQQRCFVCIPLGTTWYVDDIRRIFPEYPTPPPCDFQPPAPQPEMVRTCPLQFSSCLTIFNGTQVSRTCGELPVLDCKYANKIRYCYCVGDLCNGVPEYSGGNPSLTEGLEESDDEDLGDGSGNGGASEGSGGIVGLKPPYNDDNYFPPLTPAGPTTLKPQTNVGSSACSDMTVHIGLIALHVYSIYIWL